MYIDIHRWSSARPTKLLGPGPGHGPDRDTDPVPDAHLISIVTTQLRRPPPAIQPAHAMHCISDKQHDIHTYTYTYTYASRYAALRCAAMLQCCNAGSEWHGDIEHVNIGGGEGRSAGRLRVLAMLLCFVPRPWQQCRSRRTWGLSVCQAARLCRLLAHQPTSPQLTRGGHRSASTCPPYVGPQVTHAAGRGPIVAGQWAVCNGECSFSSCVVSYRDVSGQVLSCRVPIGGAIAVLCVLG